RAVRLMRLRVAHLRSHSYDGPWPRQLPVLPAPLASPRADLGRIEPFPPRRSSDLTRLLGLRFRTACLRSTWPFHSKKAARPPARAGHTSRWATKDIIRTPRSFLLTATGGIAAPGPRAVAARAPAAWRGGTATRLGA